MKKRTIIFFLCFLFACANFSDSQENVEQKFDTLETEHFILNIEVPNNKYPLTIEESGQMLEQFWDDLNKKIGYHYESNKSDLQPKCTIYIYRDNKSLADIFIRRGIKIGGSDSRTKNRLPNMYSHANNEIYMSVQKTDYETRETLLHEVVHRY